ncbi:ornithine cyclodeaminase family protein [Macrococcoides canis]|uniref:Delta(1)-pyrroline-2-carboxylate reductase n=1 Tax=Macrococcoides canis TaxID=1855823 RepID=A0AAE6X138_9STAP|nr:ornithine cyclodeaminase family protein [Macrococcus canis]QIH77630.1 ornithine cyclodeaminase family protein [Macrococcus canis]
MINLTKKDVKACFTMREAIEADKEALANYSKGQAIVPLRTNIDVATRHGQALFMPGYVEGAEDALGIKIVSVYPDNIEKGLPSVPATMIVMDPETGMVNGIIDGTYLTQLRTGAVQGAATELLARKDAKIGALIGTGGQAESQLEAMLTVRDLEEVRIFDIDYERAQQFAYEMEEKFHVKMIAVETSEACITDADIITSVTTSKRATFDAQFVKRGAHINGVGAYTKEMCEIPREIIKAADVVIFDTTDGVMKEAGDFITPVEDGYIDETKYSGELGELINGDIKGRQSDEDITIFKTVGSAVLDVVTASKIIKRYNEMN